MKPVRIAINGFGRIGRAAFRLAFEKKNIEICAINDLTSIENLAYLLKYDSIYGRYEREVAVVKKGLRVRNVIIPVLSEKEPDRLPWKSMHVDVVLECTGFFTQAEGAALHRKAGARFVVISAPTKSEQVKTILRGVNETMFNPRTDGIISNASCTTNCVAPVIFVLDSAFGVEKAMLSTIHAVTASQRIVDGPDGKDIRRGRSGFVNMVPTSTGAALAATKALPRLKGRFDGIAIRVPLIIGSLADIVMVVKKKVNREDVNNALRKASRTKSLRGILEVSEDSLVSSDIIRTAASSIVDAELTRVIDGDLVKVIAWYDNEWGYANRLVEQAILIGRK